MSKHQTAKRQVQHYNGTGLTSQAIHFMKRWLDFTSSYIEINPYKLHSHANTAHEQPLETSNSKPNMAKLLVKSTRVEFYI